MLLCLKAARKNGIDLDQWDHSEAGPLLPRSPFALTRLGQLTQIQARSRLRNTGTEAPKRLGTVQRVG